MNGTSRGRGLTALAAAALAAAAFMWGTFLPALRATTHGFAAYYTASRLMLDGRWSASVYDDVWFGDRVAEYVGGGVREII